MLTRRGFSLVELLVALVLLAIVSTAVYRVLVNNQRLYVARRPSGSTCSRTSGPRKRFCGRVPGARRLRGRYQGDERHSLSIRAMRWLAFACSPPVLGLGLNNLTVTIRGGAPVAFVLRVAPSRHQQGFGADLLRRQRDHSRRRRVGAGSGHRHSAPELPHGRDGRAAYRGGALTLPAPTPPPSRPTSRGHHDGAPVRGFEVVTYQLYKPAGDTSWYPRPAARRRLEQPLIGPLLPNGVTFSYFDSAGTRRNPALVAGSMS